MNTSLLIFFLAMFSLGAFLVFGVVSKKRTEQRLKRETVPSTLAKDSPGPGAVERLDNPHS